MGAIKLLVRIYSHGVKWNKPSKFHLNFTNLVAKYARRDVKSHFT